MNEFKVRLMAERESSTIEISSQIIETENDFIENIEIGNLYRLMAIHPQAKLVVWVKQIDDTK